MEELPLTIDSLMEHYTASVETLVVGQTYIYSVLMGADRRFALEAVFPEHRYITGVFDEHETVTLKWFVETRTWGLATDPNDTAPGLGKSCDGLVVRTMSESVIGKKMVPGAATPSTDPTMLSAVPVTVERSYTNNV
jgi:hypothetical protein